MTEIAKRTFSLPPEQASYIDAKVASGNYASASEVVREGLRALQQRDQAVEHWLRDVVAKTHERVQREPDSLVSVDRVFEDLKIRNAKLQKKS